MLKKQIKNLIKQSLADLNVEAGFDIPVEYPAEENYGDFASSVALRLAKPLKKNPRDIAEDLKKTILKADGEEKGGGIIEKIEIAGPGFLNFYVKSSVWRKEALKVLKQKEKFGAFNSGKNKKTQIEFVSVNPTGELHLGHARTAFYGDVLANVLEKAGFKVEREYYVNNAKASNQIKELGKTALGEGAAYLTDYLKQEIRKIGPKLDLLKKKKNKQEAYAKAGFLISAEVLKDIKNLLEKKLKIRFDNWFSEEDLYKKKEVEKIHEVLNKKNLIYEKEGAQWLKTSEFGDDEDRVVVRSNGEPSYLLPDIAYHQNKFKRGFKIVIDVWGADHQGHVKKMMAITKMLKWPGELKILISQMVALKSKGELAKFSKRKGNIITIEWLIEKVGLDVARYFYLSKSLSTQMEFDLDLAMEQSEKNPVFYVQYAHARIASVLRKVKGIESRKPDFNLLNHPSELGLMKQILKLPELIEDIATDYEVHHLTNYVYALAESFHRFYRDCRVISEDIPLTSARIGLITAAKTALKNSLDILGVSAPEKM